MVRVIITMEGHKLLGRGCEGFLCNVVDTETSGPSLKDIPVVQEFLDVFPEEIACMSRSRVKEFCIDLVPRATPISKSPWWMAPVEFKELKPNLMSY